MLARRITVLVLAIACLLPFIARAGTLTTLTTLPVHLDGGYPTSGLTEQGGRLFGTTYLGGANGNGTLFQLDRHTGHVTILYSFPAGADKPQPLGRLVGYGGKLYGVTYNGGDFGSGTVFSFDPATGVETVLHSFANASRPGGGLTEVGGLLYGTSYESDAIYSIDPSTGAEVTVHAFGRDAVGQGPFGFLIRDGGMLYGVTYRGGAYGHGVLYRLDLNTGSAEALFAFEKKTDILGSLVVDGGTLYGTTSKGALFAFNPRHDSYRQIQAFHGYPGQSYPTLEIARDGVLYGSFSNGGGDECGSLFSFNLATTTTSLLYQFDRSTGCAPNMPFLAPDDALVGTTQVGGLGDDGVAYSLDLSVNSYTVLHAFSGGLMANDSALVDLSGTLYGTTGAGGASGFGSIYKVDRHSGRVKTLSSFDGGADGTTPQTLVAIGNVLYGTTTQLGAGLNRGTIFSFDPSTGIRTTQFAFDFATTGSCPCALTAINGVLYGTAAAGGSQSNAGGTLFMFSPSTGAETTLHSFDTTDGNGPNGVVAAGGVLYGTTSYGGAQSRGTVFSFDLSSGKFARIHNFMGGSDGAYPAAGLAFGGGALFGTTIGDSKTNATIFRIDPASETLTTLYQFGRSESLVSALSYDAKKNALFGTAFQDGASTFGSLFRFDIATSTFVTLYSFTGGSDGGYPDSPLLKLGNYFFGTTASVSGEASGTVFRYDR
jgi:uncharacterized repeat protein (TIGR03803 family)